MARCRALFVVALCLAQAGTALGSAANVYITASGAAGGNCTMNVQTPTFFNDPASWGGGANQIGPGTTVHLCGTFTGAANSNLLTFHGSGSNGSPITLLFEPGTQLDAPYWAYNGGAVNTNGNSYLV